jgi:EthD domain
LIKLVFTLRRREGMTRDEFQHYWRNDHALLVQRLAEVLRIRRYVQTHARDTVVDEALAASRGSEPGYYDGVGSEAGSIAADALLEDERRFIDLANSPIWLGEERVVIERS